MKYIKGGNSSVCLANIFDMGAVEYVFSSFRFKHNFFEDISGSDILSQECFEVNETLPKMRRNMLDLFHFF